MVEWEEEGEEDLIPAEDTFDMDSTLDGWRDKGDDLNEEAPNNTGKEVVWENGTPFQTLYGTAEYGRFGYSVALSSNTYTLLVGAPGVDDSTGRVVVHHRSTTSDQFVHHQTLNREGERRAFDLFGWAIVMTLNGLAMAVAAPYSDFGKDDSGLVYFYMRYTTNSQFVWISQVDGVCNYELLGDYGVAIETSDDALYIHAKLYNDKCSDNCICTFSVR